MNIKDLINKLRQIHKTQEEEKLDKYIKNLYELKNKVASTIKNDSDCFTIEGYSELTFTSSFFDKIENWGCTRYDDVYKVTITEKGLLKLAKELKKYNLNIY